MAVFFNQATLTYNGGVANSNIVSGEIVGVITAAKTATPSTYGQGDTITYVVTLFNSGTTAVTDLTVSDNLGAYTLGSLTLVPLDYVDGSVRYFFKRGSSARPHRQLNVPPYGNGHKRSRRRKCGYSLSDRSKLLCSA